MRESSPSHTIGTGNVKEASSPVQPTSTLHQLLRAVAVRVAERLRSGANTPAAVGADSTESHGDGVRNRESDEQESTDGK
jgi:hypothetical protein